MIKRRQFIKTLGSGSAMLGLGLWARGASACVRRSPSKVVVVGGGYGGATAAKYVRLFSEQQVQVTLVEPSEDFVSCPMSNLVLQGSKTLADVTQSYKHLWTRHGINVVRQRAVHIDPDKHIVKLANGQTLPYDRLIVSPGIDFMWASLPGMRQAHAQRTVLHAWKAGPQTVALRQQLEAMPDGGIYALSIPLAPYRCPPGPYERACMVADYFRRAKPKSKIIIFDANEDIQSKKGLFTQAWQEHYSSIIDYRPAHKVVDVDAAHKTLKFEFNEDFKADVLNVIPEMRAGDIAVKTGLATANARWCEVDFLTFESKAIPHIHILGDAIQIAPGMPKSAHMANQHGKTCAAAVVALLAGQEPPSLPLYANTCYSFVTADQAIHVASVHRYDAAKNTMLAVLGAGGVSTQASQTEAQYAHAWARNIWADTLA